MKKIVFASLALLIILAVAVGGCVPSQQQPPATIQPPATTMPPPATSLPPVPPPVPPIAEIGRVVFSITDAAANMGSVTSVKVTVDSVSVHSASEGWVAASSTPKTYDLLQLKAQGTNALLADVQLKAGEYEQVRLMISKVVVTDAAGNHDAKLPSGELKIAGGLTISADSTATAMFDFLADESLHITGSGEYILAPVVQLETRFNADVEVKSDSDVRVGGGTIKTNVKVGMDTAGNVGVGLKIAPSYGLRIDDDGTIVIDLKQTSIGATIAGNKSAGNLGRVVFTVSDTAANMGSVASILLTIGDVSVHTSSNSWVAVSSTPMTYDLLQLKNASLRALLADVQLNEGTYNQLRLDISRVEVIDATGVHEAKLPSNELKIISNIVVNANSTTAVNLDFIVDESLHMTGSGEYILAPVLKFETRTNANVSVSGNNVSVSGGRTATSLDLGMDLTGYVGVGLKVGLKKNLTIQAGKIKILS